MKKSCPYHNNYNLKVFCTDEQCKSYRLLCLKCTITSEIKDSHKNHQLTLIKDLVKKLEQIKSDRTLLANIKEKVAGVTSDELAPSETNRGSSDVTQMGIKEVSKLLSNFRSLQRIINETPPSASSKLPERSAAEDDSGRVTLKPQKHVFRAKGFNALDADLILPSSLELWLPEKYMSSSGPVKPTAYTTAPSTFVAKTSGEMIDSYSKEMQIESDRNSRCNMDYQISTRAAIPSARQQIAACENDDCISSNNIVEPHSERSVAKSNKASVARSKSRKTSITPENENKQSDDHETKTRSRKPSTIKTPAKVERQINTNIQPQSACALQIVQPSNDHKEKEKEGSVMDRLRHAISKMSGGCLKDITNKPERIEEKLPSAKTSLNKSPTVYASDVYKDNDLEKEAKSLLQTELAEVSCNLQEELKRQVTGFKEFSNYTQKVQSDKVRLKDLREAWKDLPKKDREQWNCIALRKRIELREQVETKRKEGPSCNSNYESLMKKSKTTEF